MIHLKPSILFICILICSLQAAGQKIFSIRIDPRIEALSIFYTLATADTLEVKPTPSAYYKTVKTFFKPYQQHPSLNWYRQLDRWDGYEMATFGLFLSDHYPFKLKIPTTYAYIRSAPIDTFLYHFNRFYKECHMADFIRDQQKTYRAITAHGENDIASSKIIEHVQSFYNIKRKGEFIIYADVLNNHGSHALTEKNALFAGKNIIKAGYIADSTRKTDDNSPVIFDPPINVVAHECSHIYLNNFNERYRDRLYQIRKNFLTSAKGKAIPEAQWENEINELLVRVCVARIMAAQYGASAGDKEISNQARHFRWANDLYLFFDQYTKNRNRYHNIEDFYPEVIKFLEAKTSP